MKRLTALFLLLAFAGLFGACQNGTLIVKNCESCACPSADGDGSADGDLAENEQENGEAATEEDFDLEWLTAPPEKLACADLPGNWILRLGNAGNDWGSGLTRFSDGRLLLLGYYTNRIDLGTNHLTAPDGLGPRSSFLASYDANGTNQRGRDLNSEFMDADPRVVLRPLMAFSSQDMAFVVATKAKSTPQLSIDLRGYNADMDRLVTLPLGDQYITNEQETPVLLGAAAADSGEYFFAVGTQYIRHPANFLGFLYKLGKDGTQAWMASIQMGDTGKAFSGEEIPRGEKILAIRPLPDGGVIIGGYFKSFLILGEQTRVSYHDSWDFFIARLDKDGTVLWLQTFGSPIDDWGFGLSVNTDDLTTDLIAGCGDDCLLGFGASSGLQMDRFDANGRMIMGAGYGDRTNTPGQHHAAVRDKNGFTYNWTDRIEKFSADSKNWYHLSLPAGLVVNSMVADEAGGIYATGYFKGEINLFCGTLKSAGGMDAFLLHVGTIPPETTGR